MRIIALSLSLVCLALAIGPAFSADTAPSEQSFEVGFGKRDITPPAGLPMWGYGARHDARAIGTLQPMFAKAVVIHAGTGKLAIVGLDMGRGPTAPMMEQIRAATGKANIANVMISGSHTHHGPVIELTDREGFGKGKYDSAVAYSKKLPQLIIEAILEADKNVQPARMAVASRSDLNLNRNRQTKRQPKATDPMLAVMRFDDESGKPIAVLVNFAAHPVMTDTKIMKFSADYPGFMQSKVESAMKTNCLFMEGACGDMSVNPGKYHSPQLFGEHLGELAAGLAEPLKTEVPKKPSIKGKVDSFVFHSRTNFSNPIVQMGYQRAFFPELGRVFAVELEHGVPAELNTVLLNGEIALVGGSGEFFCNHSNRLKARSYFPHTLFFGYCNGHSLYFPTIEAVSEGGYGADAPVSPVEIGAGEQMMNRALINLYVMAGKFVAPPK